MYPCPVGTLSGRVSARCMVRLSDGARREFWRPDLRADRRRPGGADAGGVRRCTGAQGCRTREGSRQSCQATRRGSRMARAAGGRREVKPVLLVIAGPNGAGKTTVTVKLRAEKWSDDVEYLNPDDVARDRFGDWNSPQA